MPLLVFRQPEPRIHRLLIFTRHFAVDAPQRLGGRRYRRRLHGAGIADLQHPKPGGLQPFGIVPLRLKLDVIRDCPGTDRQCADRDAGHVAPHRRAAVDRKILDHAREQAARQARRVELGPEIHGICMFRDELRRFWQGERRRVRLLFRFIAQLAQTLAERGVRPVLDRGHTRRVVLRSGLIIVDRDAIVPRRPEHVALGPVGSSIALDEGRAAAQMVIGNEQFAQLFVRNLRPVVEVEPRRLVDVIDQIAVATLLRRLDPHPARVLRQRLEGVDDLVRDLATERRQIGQIDFVQRRPVRSPGIFARDRAVVIVGMRAVDPELPGTFAGFCRLAAEDLDGVRRRVLSLAGTAIAVTSYDD